MKFLNRTLKPQNIFAFYDGKKLIIDNKFNLEKLQKKDFKVFYFNDSFQILNLDINDEWLELEIKLEIWKYNNWPIFMDECFSILSNSIQSKLVCRVNLSTGIKYYSYYNFAKLVKNQIKLRSLSIVNQSREDNKKFSLLNIQLKKDLYNDYKLDQIANHIYYKSMILNKVLLPYIVWMQCSINTHQTLLLRYSFCNL